ncbi:hypothetical protein TPA0907_05370 [Micromonospora humidisoli]|uniref:Uncharacterized protein n=1 Tax=Micromonospora humidisoli TaxID=2807622 RepID=A0ABS2J8U8_9ACTN|nr:MULTISPECIES: hypothetical protein [Micromonospora]MBM7082965.1 hypothetical protein [Micromonospora humidisoli]GHJ06170.1 hypothetical protein TPA0907_05370 [Micromonospora sp. AKA109]
MTELEQFRLAMRATEQPYPEDLDLTAIMRDGRRLRRRRRLVGAGATALVTVLVAGGVGLGVRWTRPPAPDRPPAPAATVPGATPPATSPPTPGPTRWRPPQQPIGEVIDTGIRYGVDQRVFYLVAVDVPEGPRVRVGLMAGRRSPAGELTNDMLVNDVQGSDRRPGFHEIGYAEATPPDDTRPPVPTFGYFVGPATRIVGTAGGRQVDARLARWSTDPELVVFWFDPVDLTPGVRLDGIVARDRSGRLL